MSSTDTNREISNESIFCLSRAMRDHDTPTCSVGIGGSLKGFSDSSDLIDLEEEGIACFLLDGVLDTDGVGDSEIVTDDLTIVFGAVVGPCLPVILVEGILDTANQLNISR